MHTSHKIVNVRDNRWAAEDGKTTFRWHLLSFALSLIVSLRFANDAIRFKLDFQDLFGL